MKSARTYRSAEVAELTGASLRQLQWWDEQRVIPVHHEGHARIYSERDLADVRLLMILRRQGVSLQQARRVIPACRRVQNGKRVIFVTDGRRSVSAATAEQALAAICSMDRKRLAICDLPGRT